MGLTVRRGIVSMAFGLVLSMTAPASRGVILYWSADRATWAPTSCWYGNSGWQYEGQWSCYLGTPIAPNYFVTAKHVGGSVGGVFTYNSQTYTTTASYDSPSSDLRIWQVSTPFATYAPLYTLSNEVGKTMTVYGRGTARGDDVTVNGQLKGWTWGAFDHVESWGSNKVDTVANGGSGVGQMLAFGFDASGDYYEGSLSVGDSGGGVFIKDGSTWKLAGINYGTDGYYSYTGQNGTGFSASIFDQGGLYVGTDNAWNHIADQATDIPGSSYATRISSNMAWIRSIIGTPIAVPEPTAAALLLLAVGGLVRRK